MHGAGMLEMATGEGLLEMATGEGLLEMATGEGLRGCQLVQEVYSPMFM